MVDSIVDNGHTIFKNSWTDLAYQAHYNRQLLMKILAHIIAERASYGLHPDFSQKGAKVEWVNDIAIDVVEELNYHYAKVHFTVDELNDITKIVEEAKQFI